MRVHVRFAAAFCSLALVLVGCSGSVGNTTPAFRAEPLAKLGHSPAGSPIQHVVIIVQENRSLDNLFHGFPGADTANSGVGHDGKVYALKPLSLAATGDIDHGHYQFLQDYNRGKNTGFDLSVIGFKKGPGCQYPNVMNLPTCWEFSPNRSLAYSYVPRKDIAPYWTMASTYAFGDRMFESNNGPSYTSHQFLIAGQSGHVSENPQIASTEKNSNGPWGCDASTTDQITILLKYRANPPVFGPKTGVEFAGPFSCFSYRTAANMLDAAKITWAYYAPAIGQNRGDIWSAFDSIWPVRFGTDWLNDVKSPETDVLNDIQNGTLPQVSWVVPSFVNSDHPDSLSLTGPQWVASVVNAIGTSHYWNTTAIVVMWDDWGGWYDHVVPPQYPDPETGVYEGLGFRVPVIVISPYAKRGYVSHQLHEVASSLHFIENVFGLPSLGLADARADAFDDMFDFTQAPAAFKPIPVKLRGIDFIRQRPSNKPPDDD